MSSVYLTTVGNSDHAICITNKGQDKQPLNSYTYPVIMVKSKPMTQHVGNLNTRNVVCVTCRVLIIIISIFSVWCTSDHVVY